jgi:hypothetical protein
MVASKGVRMRFPAFYNNYDFKESFAASGQQISHKPLTVILSPLALGPSFVPDERGN